MEYLDGLISQFADKIEGLPALDKEIPTQFSDAEKKLAINHLEGAIAIEDINNLNAEGSFRTNRFWLLYVCIFLGASGLQMIALNIYMYAIQGLEGSALDSTLLQTMFSLGQLFGSPILHFISEKVGRKPIYLLTFVMFFLTSLALSFSSRENFGDFALGWMYIIRVIQGFFAIVQPLAFTIISDMAAPNIRALATSLNNVMYLAGTLLVSILNAFVLPKIPGAYPDNDDFQIFKTCLYTAMIFLFLAFCVTWGLKESCPNVLLKREAKRLGVVYRPIKKDDITLGEAFKFVFGQGHMWCLFLAYIMGFGTSVLNTNVNSNMVSKYMQTRTSSDGYKFVSFQCMFAMVVMILFTAFVYRPLLHKIGDVRMLVFVELMSCITSCIRSQSAPINKPSYIVSAILNQFGNALIDAPFITFASMQTTPRSRGKVMGVFMTANSIARAALSAIGGALLDWHWRNAQICYILFTFASILLVCFIKVPVTMKK